MVRLGLAALVAAAACGGSEKEAEEPAEASTDDRIELGEERAASRRDTSPGADESEGDEGMQVEGLRGKLDPHDIKAGIQPHQRELSACYQDRVSGFRYLNGDVEMKVVVREDGSVERAHVLESSLGAWPVEKCLLEAVRAIEFPEPEGNAEAHFTLPLSFDSGRGSVIWWEAARAEEEVAELTEELGGCAEEAETAAPRDVWVTMYVGRRGKVRSVGFASKSKAPPEDAWADCAEGKIKEWVLSDPRGRVAKLSFRYVPE